MSFCKVPEEAVTRKVLKSSKVATGDSKNKEAPGVIGSKKTKGNQSTSLSKTSGKVQDKPDAMGQQAKKKTPK
jgi:hypothetical protein